MSSALSVIREHSLFQPFAEDILQALDICGQARTYHQGDILIAEGSTGDDIFLLINGRVRVTCSTNPHTSEADIIYLERGEIIGEMAMIEKAPRSASIVAETDVEVKVWRASAWRELCDRYPKFGYQLVTGLAKILCERLRRTNANVAILNSVIWGKASAEKGTNG